MENVKDIEMSEELKKRLQSFAPIEPDRNFRYVPLIYREKNSDGEYIVPKSQWPVFNLRSLTGPENVQSDPMQIVVENGEVNEKFDVGKSMCKRVRICLLSWDNWKRGESEVKFYEKTYRIRGELTNTALDLIPTALIVELADAIEKRSKLSEEELEGL